MLNGLGENIFRGLALVAEVNRLVSWRQGCRCQIRAAPLRKPERRGVAPWWCVRRR